MKAPAIRFSDFLARFPEVDLPITLADDLHHTFSAENAPLSAEMVAQFIQPAEPQEPDELTEFIAGFRLKETFDVHALVYWRAGLLDYQYIMLTFDKKGTVIDRRVLGGTHVDGQIVTKSVATIDPDWTIYVVTGQTLNDAVYNAGESRTFELELLPDGRVVEQF